MIKDTDKGLLVPLKVVPNSSKNCIIQEESGLKIKITASPVDNKANHALIEFLSKELDVAKSNIEIIKGHTSKEKTILIKVLDKKIQATILDKLTK